MIGIRNLVTLNRVKAYELYNQMAPELATLQFLWMRENERDLYKTAIATLAEKKKLRPVFITKKSVPDQITWLTKQLSAKQSEMVGEHLLQAWFMDGQQDMLVTFCDAMEIKHDGKGTVEGQLPESLDEQTLKSAIDALFEKFPANLTSLYLYVFNLQSPTGWESLSKILAEDKRITLE